jgi:hypothetical protein
VPRAVGWRTSCSANSSHWATVGDRRGALWRAPPVFVVELKPIAQDSGENADELYWVRPTQVMFPP